MLLFECHITCNLEDADKAKETAEHLGWKTSQIERDPVLGNNPYFYLTRYDNDYVQMHDRMQEAVIHLAVAHNVKAIREKIELIMHDRRLGPDGKVIDGMRRQP